MPEEELVQNEEQQPSKKGLVSIIIMGSFLLIMLVITILLLPIDLKAMMDSIKASAESSEDQAGAAIGAVFAAFFAALGVIIFHIAYFVFIIAGGIMLIFLIKNIKKIEMKPLKIINWVLLGTDAFIITVSIVKIVLLFVEK